MHRSSATDLRRAFAGRRVLVTGARGFIAGHLADALDALGARLALVDEAPAPAPDDRPDALRLTVGEAPFSAWLEQAEPFDFIFHLAGRAYAAGSVATPTLDFAANLAATLELLEVLRHRHPATRLLFPSSAAVYGNPERLPIEEGDVTVPVSPYGVSKLASERYVAVYAQLYGIRAASLRLFSVYGPGQPKQVVYDFFRKLHETPDELLVIGDGTQVRDMVYVDDVVRAFLAVAARAPLAGEVYNVASGVGTSTAELARLVVEAQGASARVAFTGSTRPGDPERWLGDSARLRALGWAPAFDMRAGLRATAEWFNAATLAAQEVGA